MILRVSHSDIVAWRNHVEEICSEYSWFHKVVIDTDDGGQHLTIMITDIDKMKKDGIDFIIPGIKTCIISTGKKSEPKR